MNLHAPTLPLYRWLILVGLALGLILQPVLGSVGELHELTHGAASAHGAIEADMPDSDGDGAGALHQLHHLAHCCGHAVMAPQTDLALVEVCHQEPRNLVDTSVVSSGNWLAPFRPPITG